MELDEEFIEKIKELIGQKETEKVKELLSDLHPADIAELCNDLEMEDARRLIEAVVPIADAPRVHDYKTEYQELAQSVTGETPVYRIVGEEGPAHMRVFFAEVELAGVVTGRGKGSSKKHAEQQAARDALKAQGLVGAEHCD